MGAEARGGGGAVSSASNEGSASSAAAKFVSSAAVEAEAAFNPDAAFDAMIEVGVRVCARVPVPKTELAPPLVISAARREECGDARRGDDEISAHAAAAALAAVPRRPVDGDGDAATEGAEEDEDEEVEAGWRGDDGSDDAADEGTAAFGLLLPMLPLL